MERWELVSKVCIWFRIDREGVISKGFGFCWEEETDSNEEQFNAKRQNCFENSQNRFECFD